MSELKVNTISPYNSTAINVNTPGGFIVSGDVSTSNNLLVGNFTMVGAVDKCAVSKWYVDQQFAARGLSGTVTGVTQTQLNAALAGERTSSDAAYVRLVSTNGQIISSGLTFSGTQYSFSSAGTLLSVDSSSNTVGIGATAPYSSSGVSLHLIGSLGFGNSSFKSPAQTSRISQDSGNNLTINGYNSTVMQVAGSSKLTIAPSQITFGVTAANLSVSGSMTAQNVSVRGTVSISNTGVFPTSSTTLVYNRVLIGGTGPGLFLWDDGSSVAAGLYSTVGLGSRNATNSTMLAGGYIRGGNEGTTDHSGFLRFDTTPADGSANQERMRIDSNGNVGIGTNAPSNKLHIRFAQNNSATPFANSLQSPVGGILIENIDETPASGNKCRLTMATRSSGAGGVPYSSYISLTAVHGSADNTDLYIGSEYYGSGIAGQPTYPIMYIGGNSGRVGIGTDSPTASLDVNGTLKVGDFGGATNIMVKPTNAAGGVGQIIPLFTWGAGIGSATVQRNHAAPIPSGTWLIVLNGQGDAASGDGENATLVMAQTWVVPSGKYLVFAHSDSYSTAASSSTSGLAWKLVTDPAPFRTTTNDFYYTLITSANGWTNISKSNGTAQLINEQNADTATGGDKSASGCVYQGGGGWYVTTQIQGYALRIA